MSSCFVSRPRIIGDRHSFPCSPHRSWRFHIFPSGAERVATSFFLLPTAHNHALCLPALLHTLRTSAFLPSKSAQSRHATFTFPHLPSHLDINVRQHLSPFSIPKLSCNTQSEKGQGGQELTPADGVLSRIAPQRPANISKKISPVFRALQPPVRLQPAIVSATGDFQNLPHSRCWLPPMQSTNC